MHRARKRFGQHFLHDPGVIGDIVSSVSPSADEVLVEIGPGEGAITTPLAGLAGHLHVVEFDRDLARRLRARYAGDASVTVHEADALRFDFSALGTDLRIVGNLPYNISTPLLFHLLAHRDHVRDMHFMLQKEVVDRMVAAPGGRDFGRLTVMLGCSLQLLHLFDVPPEAFTPPPRVMSAVVRLAPLPRDHYRIDDEAELAALVAQAFSQRRKTIRNSLKTRTSAEVLEAAGIDAGSRPEQVPVESWIRLANIVSSR